MASGMCDCDETFRGRGSGVESVDDPRADASSVGDALAELDADDDMVPLAAADGEREGDVGGVVEDEDEEAVDNLLRRRVGLVRISRPVEGSMRSCCNMGI